MQWGAVSQQAGSYEDSTLGKGGKKREEETPGYHIKGNVTSLLKQKQTVEKLRGTAFSELHLPSIQSSVSKGDKEN